MGKLASTTGRHFVPGGTNSNVDAFLPVANDPRATAGPKSIRCRVCLATP